MTYADLMIADDGAGQFRSYLGSEENFAVLKDLETKNLLVPVIGDFGAGTVSGFVTGGYVFAGQTFTVPTPDNVLTTWRIHI